MHSFALKGTTVIAAALLLASAASTPVFAEVVSTTVSGKASPYLAGMPPGSTCCFVDSPPNDTAPDESPTQVFGIPLTPGTVLTFSVSGGVSNLGFPPTDSPDGSDFFTSPFSGLPGTDASNGIARMNAPVNALVGVFLDDGPPNGSPTPPGFDFTDNGGFGTAFGQLCPGLKQPFFIGDGLTGRGAGTRQQFVVPAGATRLFLGTVDGFDWNNNSGAFTVQVTSTTPMSIATSVNQPVFAVGQTMVASAVLNSQAQAGAADFFTGLLHPDGSTIVFQTGTGVAVGNVANPSSFRPVAVGIPLGAAISVGVPNVLTQLWTGAEPRGTYVFFVLAARSGTLADGNLGCNDILGVGTTAFSFP